MTEVIWSIQHKKDTAANWASDNPLLLNGQIGLEFNGSVYDKFKIGDGNTLWNSLPYFSTPTGGDVTGPASSNDNSIARFDGITGKIIQNSTVSLSDTGDIDAASLKADYIDLDITATPTSMVGRFGWDSETGTVQLGLDGGTALLQLGQEQVALVSNISGVDLIPGNVVYVSGGSGKLEVTLALANSGTTSNGTIGMVTEDILNGETGFVTISGTVNYLDTSALTGGQILYLSHTIPGAVTATKPPAPNKSVIIGHVQRSDVSSGSIFVNVNPGIDLRNLNEVSLTVVPATGDTLIYNAGVWENSPLTNNVTLPSGQLAVGSVTNKIASSTALTFSSNVLSVNNTLRLTSATPGTAVAGNIEFNSDKFTGVITTGTARKEFTLNDIALTAGRVAFTTTNGRITDSANLLFDTSNARLTIGSTTPPFQRDFVITKNTNGAVAFLVDNQSADNAAFSGFNFVCGTTTLALVNYSQGYTGSFANTNISVASTSYFNTASRNAKLMFGGNPIYFITGTLDTHIGISNQTSGVRIDTNINVHKASTAKLHIGAGTATAGTAPLKLTSGTNLTTPENGAFEYDGTNLYFTTGGVRKTVTLV